MERTLKWLSHQVAPTLKTLMEIDEIEHSSLLMDMLENTTLSKRHKKIIEQVTRPIEEMITRKGE